MGNSNYEQKVTDLLSWGRENYDERISNTSHMNNSGNSDVDVNVNVLVDVMPIAYAILCSSLAKNEMSIQEFDKAIQKLEELTKKNNRPKTIYDENDIKKVKCCKRRKHN
ncbi:hypothetical protein [Metabacillus arenae]|uniref:Uncharacterized protein n=1 Tax=Metabacillus arenae TaxID=2771434 RepID=A0A926NB72_9BACI|nr:hypothetical protein [Metabacillus arenae]MBD1381022.1 hypothetical protein [Metabacillus arenae]